MPLEAVGSFDPEEHRSPEGRDFTAERVFAALQAKATRAGLAHAVTVIARSDSGVCLLAHTCASPPSGSARSPGAHICAQFQVKQVHCILTEDLLFALR